MSPDGQQRPTFRHEQARRPVVGYARDYPNGWETGRHAHGRVQLLHAATGVMRVQTEAALFTVPPGNGLWMPPDIAHEVQMVGTVRMRALFLRQEVLRQEVLHQKAAARGAAAPVVITVSPLLVALIDAVCGEPPAWHLQGRGRHLAALILDELARAQTRGLALPAGRDARLRRVCDRLRAHPADPRDLAELALLAGASPRTLARLFRRETGLTFDQWRRHLRLSEGLSLLAAGRTPKQAASGCGYASLPAFGAAIRLAFGLTPGQIAAHRPAHAKDDVA